VIDGIAAVNSHSPTGPVGLLLNSRWTPYRAILFSDYLNLSITY